MEEAFAQLQQHAMLFTLHKREINFMPLFQYLIRTFNLRDDLIITSRECPNSELLIFDKDISITFRHILSPSDVFRHFILRL